ncbi:MAG: protein-L-isoaspartate(D-aspartate) O-methyltransferase [Bacteroidia bacterium]|nr:protein-L-isoaspartate(D-aspartate) O-methyltransferase [Bacteroidia bacterium]MDW8015411.1 protein-L-isoaspartate(D-aspartate) O-methyltransferase [Bacteroidia bacterium]
MEDTPRHQGLRRRLVQHLSAKGIQDKRVLKAMEAVPRHLFVEPTLREHAYEDRALPIAEGQTISQPYTVAYQTELLAIEPGQKVLEIGTGSGYQAAILCEMGAEVYSVELERNLYEQAKKRLEKLGYAVRLRWGDGQFGWPTYAPFDRILLTAGTEKIPPALFEQLAEGGLLVAPVTKGFHEVMMRFRKSKGAIIAEEKGYFRFVPLRRFERG